MITAERWKPADDLKLEPHALEAATETQDSVALGAGPGAGKTEMLAQRADFLLRTGACPYPQRILAISFKVDAAHNLKSRVRQRCGPELAARLDSHTFHAFAKRIIDRFRPVLSGQDALDPDYTVGERRIDRKVIAFEDFVPLALTILEGSLEARNAIRQTYSHAFLDEFQDCTDHQYRLIQACFLDTPVLLTAVGDTKQSIMGWAGALDGVFRHFVKDFGAKSLNLYQNFRSAPRLRRMQNAMVKVMDPAAALDEADIIGNGGEIELLLFDDEVEEAESVAAIIRRLREEQDIALSEIAILVARLQPLFCQSLYDALAQEGIPYREEDTVQDLAKEPAARLLLDFLMLVTADNQPAAHLRMLDIAVFSHGFDEEREHQQRSRWDRFVEATRAAYRRDELDLSQATVIETLTDAMLSFIERPALLALSHDYRLGTRFEEVIDQAHAHLLKQLGRGVGVKNALTALGADEAVRVMTIHKSKGLEFDTVFLLAVEKETYWAKPDDERSLFFVGASRTKERLYLTACDKRSRPVGARGRWDVQRTPHPEFLDFCDL